MQKSLKDIISLFNFKFFFVALIHYFIVLHNASIMFNKVPDFNEQRYFIIKILAAIILIIFWQAVPYVIKKIREKDKKTIIFIKYFSIYFSIMLIFLLLTWPGIWRNDEFYIFYSVRYLSFASWHHWITSAFYIFCMCLIPFPVGIVFFQTLFISMIVGYILTETESLLKSKYTYFLFIPFLFPSIISNNLYPLRLPLYSYVELLLFSSIIFKYLNKSAINYKNILLWGILTSIVATWRSESVFLLITIPILLAILFHKQLNIKQLISYILIISICSGWIIKIQNKGMEKDKYKYILTAVMTPLSSIFETNFKSDNKTKDIETINKIIDINSMTKTAWMRAFFKKYALNDVPQKEAKELIKVYIKLVIYNFPEFLNERLLAFKDAKYSGIADNIDVFHSSAYLPSEFNNIPINSNLRLNTINFLECKKYNNHTQETFLYNFFYTPIISFIITILLIAMGIYKRNKLLFFIPLLILMQTILTILTMPTPFFMYFLPIYISSYVFLTMLIIFHFSEQKAKKMNE